MGKLDGVHPDLIAAKDRIFAVMLSLGHQMMVTDGGRETERQQELFAQGRTTPGAIVTQADGVVKRSNHQVQEDGFFHAIDCCFVVDGKPSWDEKLPWRLFGEVSKACGCKWGGDFMKLKNGVLVPNPDNPHIEWPND